MEFSLEHRFPLQFAYQKDRSHFSLVKLPTLPGLAGLWIKEIGLGIEGAVM